MFVGGTCDLSEGVFKFSKTTGFGKRQVSSERSSFPKPQGLEKTRFLLKDQVLGGLPTKKALGFLCFFFVFSLFFFVFSFSL
jgi:hypothetical protein